MSGGSELLRLLFAIVAIARIQLTQSNGGFIIRAVDCAFKSLKESSNENQKIIRPCY
jgi:hypothetical protein